MPLHSVLFRPIVLKIVLALFSALLAGGLDRAESADTIREKPESVLRSLSRAYAARDIAAYEQLLAPDFRFQWQKPDHTPGASWSREDDLKGTRNLFQSAETESITWTLLDSGVTTPEGPGLWRISGFRNILEVRRKGSSEPLVVRNEGTMSFLVRLVPRPTPHYVIAEWTDTDTDAETK